MLTGIIHNINELGIYLLVPAFDFQPTGSDDDEEQQAVGAPDPAMPPVPRLGPGTPSRGA